MQHFICPACTSLNQSPTDVRGNSYACFHCKTSVLVDSQGNASILPSEDHAVARDEDEEILSVLEDFLLRMIQGAFRFPFVTLPHWIYRWVVAWFPKVVRVVKLVLLLLVWLAITLGPLVFGSYVAIGEVQGVDPVPNMGWLYDNLVVAETTMGLWSLLSLVGSVWGLLYLKRKRRARAGEGSTGVFAWLKWKWQQWRKRPPIPREP